MPRDNRHLPPGRTPPGDESARQWRPIADSAKTTGLFRLRGRSAGPHRGAGGKHQHLAEYLRDLFRMNAEQQNFRFFCPDETTSNRMEHIFEATNRAWIWPMVKTDEFLAHDGRVMEILSEHTCEGWLEGYLLTGRHGIFASYEGFIPIVDSMMNQYAKWLESRR